MTTVRARLVVDHQIASERTFTCVARSGSKTVYASTTVHKGPRHLIKQHNLTDLLMTNANLFGGLRPVRITHYFKSILALMGSNLILPCKTIGRPRAEVTWLDVDDNVITGQESRFKVSFKKNVKIASKFEGLKYIHVTNFIIHNALFLFFNQDFLVGINFIFK